jgi:Chaperone of endosialidase
MNQSLQFKAFGNFVILVALACFAFLPTARAVTPAPDGGYPGGNTAEGEDALFSLTPGGIYNTALGFHALYNATNGFDNTATGWQALASNTTGVRNTATGAGALLSNTVGASNTANGVFALFSNTTGFGNTAIGDQALGYNTTGYSNTAAGTALGSNTTGFGNTATGTGALGRNTTGFENTATGHVALSLNTTGQFNVAVGHYALYLNTTGSGNIALGESAGINLTTGSNNIDIGNAGVGGESNTIRIGVQGTHTRTFVAGISATPISGAIVRVSASGQLGTVPSSERFKQNIKPMDKASEAILALKPVTFRYKKELDPDAIPQFGLVAEDVAGVNPDLVLRDEKGQIYTVRYDAVNAMLLNEFLKEHQKVQKLEAALAAVNERLKAQDAKIDKVNAKVELTRPTPTVAENR